MLMEIDKENNSGKNILCIGLMCLDIIDIVDHYPIEDSDYRSVDHYMQRGGNASNNCTVLSLLGQYPSLLATIVDCHDLKYLEDDLKKYGIDYKNCIVKKNYQFPVSTIIINLENGSRTILHSNKNLPEVTFEDFIKVNISKFNWIHFEGRPSVDEIVKMLTHINIYNENTYNKVFTSVEIEKKRKDLSKLANMVDVIFVSRQHANMLNLKTKEEALKYYINICKPGAIVIVPWAEEGAVGQMKSLDVSKEIMYSCPSFSDGPIIDTLGAGDTFVAACLKALNEKKPIDKVIEYGCRIAGHKCSGRGFDNIKNFN